MVAVEAHADRKILWVDCVKMIACVLVTLTHLYMSMAASGWIDENAWYYCLPVQSIYTFHVPLFFVCSGFLYQRKKTAPTMPEHIKSIKEKLLNLGVPYVTFSVITLLLKTIFSDYVNNQAPHFFSTLLWNPIAPYWYLYTLFWIIVFIPRQKDKKGLAAVFFLAVIAKLITTCTPTIESMPAIISKPAGNAVWFAAGMMLTEDTYFKALLQWKAAALALCLGMLLCVIFYREKSNSVVLQTTIAVCFVYGLVCCICKADLGRMSRVIHKTRKYFMPVFLMHTIAAAGIRTVLLKLGITSSAVRMTMGALASFLIPVLAYEIADKAWFLQFWIEPSKALRRRNK